MGGKGDDGDGDESYLVFPVVMEEGEDETVPAPAPDDAQSARATAQHHASSMLPTLLQRLRETLDALQQHHQRLLDGVGSLEQARRCGDEAQRLLDATSGCHEADGMHRAVTAARVELRRLLDNLDV